MTTAAISTAPAGVCRSKRLKFSLGGFLLYAVRFQAWVMNGSFIEPAEDARGPRLPMGNLPAGVRAALVLSHPIREKLPCIGFTHGLIRYAPHQYRRFHVDLSGTFEAYLSRFSARRRKHLRREVKRFLMAGPDQEMREYSKPEEMAEYFRLAREVSSKTYQEQLVDAGLPVSREFFEDLMERSRRDAIRGYILFHHGAPVAYEYCPAEGRILLCERVGYDPEFRHLGPGTVLLYLVIECLFRSGRFEQFDFGAGEFEYKAVFGTGHRRCADIYFFRRTMRNAVLIAAHSALNVSWGAAAAVLDRLGLRAKLRKAVRRRYGK